MRRLALSLPLLGLLLVSLPAQEKTEVIYPRGSAETGAPAPAVPVRGNTPVMLGLAAVAAGAGWWLWQKRRAGLNGPLGSARLAIAESRSLGSRQYLVVADYDGRKYLLGVCPGRIEMLTPLDGSPTGEKL